LELLAPVVLGRRHAPTLGGKGLLAVEKMVLIAAALRTIIIHGANESL
jgi:hypothetical protein